MPEEQRKPFRSIGMRMQRFSHSLMRSYMPASEELPTVEPIAPVWQAATQVPLDWGNQSPAAPASVLSTQPPNPLSVNAVPEFPLSPAPINMPMPAAVPISPVAPTTPVPPAAPASQTIQRASASPAPAESSSYKHDPRLLAILAAHEGTDNKRETIREEKKAKIEAAEAAFDSNNQTTLQRSRRSRASFDYVETSALSKGEEQQTTSKSDTPASTEANADADDEGSQPTAQAAGPPIEAPAEVTPQQPDVINRQVIPETPQSSFEDVSSIPKTDSVPSTAAFESPVQPSIDDEVLSPAPRQQSQQPTVTPSVEPAAIQRSVTHNPAQIPAAPTTTDNVASEVPALKPSQMPESSSDDVSPAPSVTSETSQPSPVIRRQAAPETTFKPVSPTADTVPAADVSPVGVGDSIVEGTAPIPPSVTATPTPAAPSIQRTAAPDVVPSVPENTVASAEASEPITASNSPTPTPAAPSIQRTAVPDVIPSAPENTAVSAEPVAPTPAAPSIQRTVAPDVIPSVPEPATISAESSEPTTAPISSSLPPAAPSIQRTAAPDVIPSAPENTAVSAEASEPTAASNSPTPTPVAPSIQRTVVPDVIPSASEPAAINSEAPKQAPTPVSATSNIQRSENPDTSSSLETGVPQSMLSGDVDAPTFTSAPQPDVPIQRTSASAADERGTWHTPAAVHHEANDVLPLQNEPIQPPRATDVSPSSEPGMWHTPDNIQREVAPEVVHPQLPVANAETPAPVQPSTREVIQRAEAPQVSNPQPPVASAETPAPVQPSSSEVIQRAEAPAVASVEVTPSVAASTPTTAEIIQRAEALEVASPQSPVTSVETPSSESVQASVTEVIQRAEAPQAVPASATEVIQRAEAPEVSSPQSSVTSEEGTPSVPTSKPATAEIIQRAEAPAATSPQSPVASVETPSSESVQASATEVIQRAEAPAAKSPQPPVTSVETPSHESVQASASEVIQRTEPPQAVPAVVSEQVETQLTPTATEVIQRAEAPAATSPQPPVTSVETASPEPIQPHTSEIIQRSEAPAVDRLQSQVTSEETTSFETAPPSSAEVIQRAEAPQATTSVNRPNPTPTVPEVIQPSETYEPPQAQPPSTDVHEMDLFEAFSAASDTFVNPSTPVINRDIAAPTGFVQRTPDVPETAAPIQPTASEIIQRSVDVPTSPAEVDTSIQQYDTEESSVRRAVDDELLSLLQSFKAQQSNPPPASKTSPSTSSPAPAPIVQRQSMPNVQQPIQRQEAISPQQIQRAIENDSYEEPERASNTGNDTDVDVDRLARDVYQLLQNRLRIERERRDRL